MEIKLKAKYRRKGGTSYKSASSNGGGNKKHRQGGTDLKKQQDISRANARKRIMLVKANGNTVMTDA